MRKNVQQVFAAFQEGTRRRPADSIWTDGDTVYSYGTAILTRGPDGTLILNNTSYSRTTSTHQGALRFLLAGLPYVMVTDAPRGFTAASMRDAVRTA